MKHKLLLCTAVSMCLIGGTAMASNLVSRPTTINLTTRSVTLPGNGLAFNKVDIHINTATKTGFIEFLPQSPQAMHAPGQKIFLIRSDTVGALKSELVSAINYAMQTKYITNYLPLTVNNITVYGGPYLNSINSFTNYKVLEANTQGVPYRVKITFSPKNRTNILQTVVQGNFNIVAKKSSSY